MAPTTSKAKEIAGDAIKLLADDHRKVEKLVEKFEKLKDGADQEKQELVREACMELKIHAQVEEEIFYPAAREALKERDLLDEAEVEHTVAKQLISELESMTPKDDLFDAKFTVLGEYVKHHVQEEEKELFPKAKRAKLDMNELGHRIIQRKQELIAEMQPPVK
jgi:hemerythrin superfamily protein